MSHTVYTRVEQLSARTYLVVESDRFGQFPFLYVILGEDKCILIDTGCGSADYREFVTTRINKNNLPYLVVNTHVHFDHVGGNHKFCGEHKSGCVDICMGCKDRTFSQNYEINSLAMAHHGAQVKNYTVSRWLQEGDLIYLDDKNPTKENSLEVLFTPGHTPDSISLFAHWENRLFIGDHLYPFTVVHLDCIGSNVNDYLASTHKLIQFVANQHKDTKDTKDNTQQQAPAEPTLDANKKEVIQEFKDMLGLDSSSDKIFSVETLMELCDWNVAAAVDFYLSSASEMPSMCPPKPTTSVPKAVAPSSSSGVQISCGHVEANMGVGTLEEAVGLLEAVRADALPPQQVDGEYAEYL